MTTRTLTDDQLTELEQAHCECSERRMADRIKAVILLGKGWSPSDVAEALLLDRGTTRGYFRRYEKGGLGKLLHMDHQGSQSYLNDIQQLELARELDQELYSTTTEIIAFIYSRWGVRYTERGANSLLHRLGFAYKKTKAVPGKADAEAQKEFLESYEQLKKEKEADSPIYFADATHPQHNTQMAYAWVRRGQERQVLSNTGRQRLNINGAIDIQSHSAVICYEQTVNAAAAIRLFQALEEKHPEAPEIHVICDNARYYRARMVRKYLENSRVKVHFLPPYSPNLNLIERFWKFFKKNVLYNRYYEKFDQFKSACDRFFGNLEKYRSELRSLLTENFEIIGV